MCRVIYEEGGKAKPRPHEKRAAGILAEYFKSDVIFLKRTGSKTPDLFVVSQGRCYEIKSPSGDGKRTIYNNLREAQKQSHYIVLDLSRTKREDERYIARAHHYLVAEKNRIKKLIILKKNGKVIDIK